MKKLRFSFALFPNYLLTCILIGALSFASCEKESAPVIDKPIEPNEPVEQDEVLDFAAGPLLLAELLASEETPLIGYLDSAAGVLFADLEKIDVLRQQYQPLKETESVWVIEKNGQPQEFFLAPLMEADPEKPVGKDDEVTRENEYCKELTKCFYGRTAKQWYKYTAESITACVVRKDEYCTGRYERHEVELHSEDDCVTPEVDEDGKIVKDTIGIFVCTR